VVVLLVAFVVVVVVLVLVLGEARFRLPFARSSALTVLID
jgi:hypothetical protein